MGKLKQETMIDATEERKNRMNGEAVLLTPHEAKIHDDIFINEYTDYSKLSKKRFTQWLSIFGQFHGHKIIEGKTNNRRWIIFENENTPPPPPDDVWDELNNKAGF